MTTPTSGSTHALDRQHVFHSWSAQKLIDPPVIVGGSGSRFWTEDGTTYLDLASQLVNLNVGHQHPDIVGAITRQAETLATIMPGCATDARSRAAAAIARHTPGDLSRIFFTNGGAEANENAVRMARLYTGRPKVLSMYRSYHGATAGVIGLTGDPRRWPSEPFVPPGLVKFFGPYPYRSSFWADSAEQECERALEHLESVIAFEGPHTIAAIVMETIVGTNGVLVPPDGYLAGVRGLCDRHGIVMICDEVMVGFGRTGAWFSVDHWGVVPDLITFAKGVNSGYVPLGGVAIGDAIAETFDERVYPGGLTYSGHVLACATAIASVELFEREQLVERSARLGAEIIGPALAGMAERHPSVGDVRGLGCFWAIELVRNRETKEMLVPFNASGAAAEPMSKVIAAVKAGGVYPFAHFNRLQIAPPLTIGEADLQAGLEVIDAALDVADTYVN